MRNKAPSTLAVMAAAALVLAGCSNSGSSSADVSGGSKDAVKVAFLGNATGAAGSTGKTTMDVVEAWGRYINDNGGLDGHPVEVIAKDVAGATGTNVNDAKEVIGQKVAAIFDLDTSDTQWVKLAEQAKIPVIAASSVSPLISTNVFPVINGSNAQTYEVIKAAKKIGDNTAVGYAAEVPLSAQYAAQMATLGKQGGVSVVVSSKLSASQPDYTAFCQLLKDKGADSYILALSTPIAKKVTDQCWQQGVEIPQVIFGGQTPRSWLKDPAYQGAVAQDITAPFFDDKIPGVASYRTAMKKYLPDLLGSADDSSAGTTGWAMGKMLEYAVEKGGGVTSDAVTKGLYTAKNETLDGLIAPVTYTEGETTHVPCGFFWTIKDKDFALTDAGAKPVCAPEAAVKKLDDQLAKALG
ncbi:ABC transporter substrate-binding protein [Streptomyces sp. NPDC051985]|uniref:ABC transporter substrate-binding protein n=1 Tax=Streptomyces sp. NPDC051985 TaxID=3155807 RepID=UPI00342F3B95